MSRFRFLSRRSGLLSGLAAATALAATFLAVPAASFAEPLTTVTVTVTDPAGEPLSGVDTQLWTSHSGRGSASGTDSAGKYTFENVMPGSYFLYVLAPADSGYITIRTPDFTVDTAAVAIAEQFVVESSISGTVSSVDGGDMTDAYIVAYGSDGGEVMSTYADAQGNYTVHELRAGSYELSFQGPADSPYVSQSWTDTVVLGEAHAATGYDVTLQLPPVLATVSGTVTGSDHPGVGLADISIFVFDPSGNWLDDTTTDQNGDYSIPLSPGTYILSFQDRTGTDYLEQFYDNKSTLAKATRITVGTTNVTATSTVLQLGGSISGQITDASTGLGIPNASVYLNPTVGTVAAAAEADSDGFYRVTNIPLGSYTVRYDLEGYDGRPFGYAVQYWDNHANERDSDPVTFASGTTIVNRNVALAPLFTATAQPTISGTAAVGSVLAASTATWTPAADVAYQWLRDGVAIPDATASSYTVVNADGGSKLTVTATGTRSGYATTSTTSAATATVTGAVFVPATPVIGGSAVVGQRLTVTTGNWSPKATSFSYSWKRGAAQVGTSSSYTLAAADLGQTLTVTVTASKSPLAPVSATSAATDTVAAAVLTATPVPTVTGTPAVGQTLKTTVSSTAWKPSPVVLSYQWLRDDAAIAGATASSYTLTNADAGATMAVTVTGTKAGYTTVSETSTATALVTGGTLTAPTPTVTGTTTVGNVLDATVGAWLPVPVTLSYQWYRDGNAIADATDTSYALTGADAGAAITFAVTGSKSGFGSASAVSVATAAIASGTFTATPTPTVTGDLLVGAVLTANPGTWAPGSVALAYQWNRDGLPIAGATSQSYLLDEDDALASISLTVTGSELGFTETSATSTASGPVIHGVITPGTATITGTAQVGAILTASQKGFLPAPGAITYEWSADGTTIAGANGSSLAITAAELGKKITVTVTASLSDYRPARVTTQPTDAVIAAPAVRVSATEAAPGSTITITGERFISAPSFDLELRSTPVLLGSVSPDATGDFTTAVTIPAATTLGMHHVVVLDANGAEITSVEITVTAATSTRPLAVTGGTISLHAGVASLGTLFLGLVLVSAVRRRRTHARTGASRERAA